MRILSCVLFLLAASPAARAQTPFTIDPARSSLEVVECSFNQVRAGFTLASAALQGGARVSGSGVVVVNFDKADAPTSISFLPQTTLKLDQPIQAAPSTRASDGTGPGGSGQFPANFGFTGLASEVPINAAVSALAWTMQSAPLPLQAGSFSGSGITFECTSGDFGYRGVAGGAIGTIRGGGPIGPLKAPNASRTACAYAVTDGVATLTIPVEVTCTITSPNSHGTATAKVKLSGVIVATAPK